MGILCVYICSRIFAPQTNKLLPAPINNLKQYSTKYVHNKIKQKKKVPPQITSSHLTPYCNSLNN